MFFLLNTLWRDHELCTNQLWCHDFLAEFQAGLHWGEDDASELKSGLSYPSRSGTHTAASKGIGHNLCYAKVNELHYRTRAPIDKHDLQGVEGEG